MCRFEMEGCIQKENENRASWKKKTEAGEKEERCATKQNLSSSLSSAITVETGLFLFLVSPSLSSSFFST